MIIFLLFVLSLIIGIVCLAHSSFDDDILTYIGLSLACCGIILVLSSLVIILCNHTGINVEIETKRIEYESLCERLEIVNSDYEDVSKSEVIKNIADWNVYVTKKRYWTYNPWTNWFYSKKLTDSLKYIE